MVVRLPHVIIPVRCTRFLYLFNDVAFNKVFKIAVHRAERNFWKLRFNVFVNFIRRGVAVTITHIFDYTFSLSRTATHSLTLSKQ